MTNEEKAKNIAESYEDKYSEIAGYDVFTACLEMAEWKDKNFDDESIRIMFIKVCYFLEHEELTTDFDWQKMSMKFIEYMKEQDEPDR